MDVRIAELLVLLSFGADLGTGQPMEHVLRQTVIAVRLAEKAGAPVDVAYYTSLLAWVGCHIDAYEQAKWFGDDLAVKRDFRLENATSVRDMITTMVTHVGAGRHGLEKIRTLAAFMTGGMKDIEHTLQNHCFSAAELARRLRMSEDVILSLAQTFERWDGRGPGKVKGDNATLPSRLVGLADVLAVYHRAAGVDAVTVETVLAAEPAARTTFTDDELDAILEAIGDFVDLKSPFTIGHSRAVAELARDAAHASGFPERDVKATYRAGLVHDIGRVGVSNAIWDKPGELTEAEMERVRLHPYLTGRM